MKIEVEKQDKFVAIIQLEIPPEQATQEYSKACKRLSQRLNIPGFRRGKAPRAVIEKTVGVDRIKQEAMDRILPLTLADVISEHQLDVVASPQIEKFSFDFNTGITVKAQVELRPEVTLPDLSNFKVEVPEFKNPADAEERELTSILDRMTTLESVIDRESLVSDIVNIDFTGYISGEPIRGGAAKNYRLDLSNNNFIEGFAPQVVGHKIGEEFKIQVTFPADYHDTALAAKPAEFVIKINEIMKKVSPELTDEVARKIGPYESVDELKTEIKRLLADNEERENTFRKQKALVDDIVTRSQVEVPDSMVNREAKLLMEEVKQRIRNQGMSWEQFLDSQGHETIWENLRKEATQRIRTSLVFGAIAKQENVVVNDVEFTNQVRELAQLTNVDEKNVMRQLANNPNAAQAMNDQLLSQKIVTALSERTTYLMVEESQVVQAEKATVGSEMPSAVSGNATPEQTEVVSPQ
ncbi:MAG: trigger factor [Cyanobacteria bacterium]|nr:trigger factor [Cyanobacteriota bacterium]